MRILCVTSVKNEAPYLLEWIAHLQALGVSDFLVYSNDCTDGTDQMLDVLQNHGGVTHVAQTVPQGESPQWQAFRAAWKHPLRKACDWALVCDVDEFVNLKHHDTLPNLIASLPEAADAIALPWRLFGAGGQDLEEDRPTLQRFTKSASASCCYPIAATFFKTLFRLDGPFNQFGVHRPKQKASHKAGLPVWLDGSGHPLPEFFASTPNRLSLFGLPVARDLVELNHYSLRSVQSFLVKRARGLPNRSDKALDLAYWAERNFNTVENTSILRLWDQTQAALRDIRALAGVAKIHQKSVAFHQSEFDRLILNTKEQKLFSRLMLAGDSRELSAQRVRMLVDSFQTAHQTTIGGV